MNASISCTDYGVCSCKERVIGNKCSECKNGTFNLADQNQYGCTECMCSGITENCTSTSLYRSQVRDFVRKKHLELLSVGKSWPDFFT